MLNLMYITNDISLAKYALKCGVDRIFIDLETLGKYERQGHKDTLISNHKLEDVSHMRQALPHAKLLVRINPLHDGTVAEIEEILQSKPQMIMLPMYTSASQVRQVAEIIKGRCSLIPLLETAEALDCAEEVCQIEGVDELYVGLNDLHLALNLKFMFELLANGTVERLSHLAKHNGKRFGFGGIARLTEGLLKAEYIIGEHIRLNSSAVILSRTFHRKSQSIEDLEGQVDFANEITKIRNHVLSVLRWSPLDLEINQHKIKEIVQEITENL